MITKDEVLRTAELAGLYISPQEADSLTAAMQSIVDFADVVKDYGEPCRENADAAAPLSSLRRDEAAQGCGREALLSESGGGEDGFFVLKGSR